MPVFDSGVFDSGVFDSGGATGSFSAAAVVLGSQSGSFTAEAWIPGGAITVEDDFTADALILREQSGNVTVDADIKCGVSDSFTADAWIKSIIPGSLTADAALFNRFGDWSDLVSRGGSPLLWYRMLEASGSFLDYGTTGAHLATVSGVTRGASGYVDGAASFAGAGYASTGTTTYVVAVGNTLTMEAWVYPTSATRMTILGCNNVAGVIQLEMSATRQVSAIINSTFIATSTANDVTLNAWNHIVYTRSGAGAGTHKIYVNGTLRTLTANSATGFSDTAAPRYVGARATSSQRWQGLIDEVLVYSRAFSQSDVNAHYGYRRAVLSDAVVLRGSSSSFTADAEYIVGVRVFGSFTSNAVRLRTYPKTFTANAVIKKTQTGAAQQFTADAEYGYRRYGSFTSNAVRLRTYPKTFTADARTKRTYPGSFTADAEYMVGHRYLSSFSANAVVLSIASSSLTANAVVKSNSGTRTFTADAKFLVVHPILADALVLWTVAGSITANAIIVPPPTFPGGGGIPSGGGRPGRISIWINGLNYTPHVIWSTAAFTAKVNGSVGDGFVQIIDRAHDFDFTFGQEIYLNIDGVIRWGGWILRPQRTFALPVITNVMLEPRTWVLECVDFNMIFDKRVIHDAAHPDKTWDYNPGTYDDTIINDVWKYLDMEGFTKDIDRVAVAILDIPNVTTRSNSGQVASGGFTFRDVMTTITRTTAAIFYCTPEKVITYVDSDKINSVYTLTDKPYPSTTSLVFSDDFNRIVSPGLGGDWVHDWGNTGYASVDGSTAVMQAAYYEGFADWSITVEPNMSIQFDFWVQSVASMATGNQTYYYGDFSRSWFDLYPYIRPTASPFEMEIELAYYPNSDPIPGVNYQFVSIMADQSSWYTAKMEQYGGGLANGGSRLKIWKRGTNEPSEWLITVASVEPIVQGPWPVRFEMDGSGAEVARVDNFFVWTESGTSYTPPANAVAYREIKIREDATSMVNDALVWGAGYGSQNIVFSRHQDTTSQTDHGLWQAGEFKSGVYKQATADAISESWVDGSPSAHRGAKNPKRSVELVTQSTVFSVGDVVDVECSGFDYSDTLPIRSMTITFPTPFDPRFALTMTWEIDSAWSMFDPWKPPVVKAPPPGGGGGGGTPCLDTVVTTTGTCDEAICGITDTFTRTVADGWGTSDAGIAWDDWTEYGYEPSSVNGSRGLLNAPASISLYPLSPIGSVFEVSGTFELNLFVTDDYGTGILNNNAWGFILNDSSYEEVARFQMSWFSARPGYGLPPSLPVGTWRLESGDNETTVEIDAGVEYNFRVAFDFLSHTESAKIWQVGTTEPSAWQASYTDSESIPWPGSGVPNEVQFHLNNVVEYNTNTHTVPQILYLDNLDITGVDRCSEYRFDNFNRTVAAGWGTSDTGYAYTTLFGPAHGSSLSVDGSSGKVTVAAGGVPNNGSGAGIYLGKEAPAAYPFTIKTRMKSSNIGMTGYPAYGTFIGVDTADGNWYMNARITLSSGGGYSELRLEEYQNVEPYGENWGSSDFDISGVAIGTWINIEIEFTSGLTKMRWYVDGSVPSAWDEMVTSGNYLGGRPFVSAVSFGPTFIAWWDYIDFDYTGKPCYQDCLEESISDSFARTTSNGWGTSTSGAAWTTSLVAGWPVSTFSTDGSTGIIDGSGQSFGSKSGWVHIPTFGAWDLTATFKFKYTGTLNSFQSGFCSTWSGPTTLPGGTDGGFDSREIGGILSIYADAPGTGATTTEQGVHPTATAGVWYNCKIVTTTLSTSVKIWKTTDTEPASWTSATATVPAADSASYFDIGIYGGMKVWIDDLQVSSAGCTRLVPHVIDDWNNRTYTVVWGNTSGTGDPWSTITDGGQYSTVSDGVGKVALYVPSVAYESAIWTLNEGGSSFSNPYVMGSGVPDELFTGTSVIYSLDFMCDDGGGHNNYIEILLNDNVLTTNAGVNVGVSENELFLDSYDATFKTYPWGTWSPNTWYTVKVQIIGSSASAKVWERGTSEPGWMLSLFTDPMPWSVGEFTLYMHSYYNNNTVNFAFDNFVRWTEESGKIVSPSSSTVSTTDCIGQKKCGDVLVPQSAPSGGFYPSGTEWRTVQATYLPGSTKLAVNGIYQYGKYTESDPDDGIVTTNFSISDDDIVTLCYITNGALP